MTCIRFLFWEYWQNGGMWVTTIILLWGGPPLNYKYGGGGGVFLKGGESPQLSCADNNFHRVASQLLIKLLQVTNIMSTNTRYVHCIFSIFKYE